MAKGELQQAAKDYLERGYVTNYSNLSRVWHSSNIVSISGTEYECFITISNERFNGEGTLTVTTNGTFIWLDTKQGQKIIGAGYRTPFFPPRF